jgi:hypothetical protein
MLYSQEFAVSSDLCNVLKPVHVIHRTCSRENLRTSDSSHSLLVLDIYIYIKLPMITNNAFTQQALLWTCSYVALGFSIIHDTDCPDFCYGFLKFLEANAGIVP